MFDLVEKWKHTKMYFYKRTRCSLKNHCVNVNKPTDCFKKRSQILKKVNTTQHNTTQQKICTTEVVLVTLTFELM